MAITDSLGNTYTRLPAKPDNHTAKPSKGGSRKHGRNINKYGKAANVTRKVRTDSRPNRVTRSRIAFIAGTAAADPNMSRLVEGPICVKPGHTFLATIPLSWLIKF
jgi:hypothetical protein